MPHTLDGIGPGRTVAGHTAAAVAGRSHRTGRVAAGHRSSRWKSPDLVGIAGRTRVAARRSPADHILAGDIPDNPADHSPVGGSRPAGSLGCIGRGQTLC